MHSKYHWSYFFLCFSYEWKRVSNTFLWGNILICLKTKVMATLFCFFFHLHWNNKNMCAFVLHYKSRNGTDFDLLKMVVWFNDIYTYMQANKQGGDRMREVCVYVFVFVNFTWIQRAELNLAEWIHAKTDDSRCCLGWILCARSLSLSQFMTMTMCVVCTVYVYMYVSAYRI